MFSWEKIKNIIMPDADDFDDFEDEEDEIYQAPEVEETHQSTKRRAATSKNASSKNTSDSARSGGKVMDIQTTARLQVVVTTPEHFDEASGIADELKERRTVVLNLESANRDQARRLVDFLGGVAYANDGQIKRIANSTFIITPYNVDVMGDFLDELENKGVYV